MTQLKTRLRGGFTLVELIVVITILAILGTIGFMSFQGYTADARNTKRTSDIGSIASALTVKKAGSSLASVEFVVNDGAYLSSTGIAGRTTGTEASGTGWYRAGTPNYAVLGIKKTEFLDPANGLDYRIAATTYAGGSYEVAATLETGDSRTAAIKGEWSPRTNMTTLSWTRVGDATSKKFSVSAADGVKFNVGDFITVNAVSNQEILNISSDGKYITFSGTALNNASGTNLGLAISSETLGLIESTTANTAVQKDTSFVPYSLN